MGELRSMTMCTSTECPMRKECYRSDFDSNQCKERFNYEYTCNETSGFNDFVYCKYNHKKQEGV